MEGTTNVPVVAKKICNFIRVMFFMLKKGVAKRKLMVDLNIMMKRGKIAGKAMHNLVHHHRRSHHHHHDHHLSYPTNRQEYEFSCSNTPSFPLNLLSHRKHHHSQNSHFFSCAHAPQTMEDDMDMMTVSAVQKVFDMLNNEALSPAVRDMVYSELSSPALPGFGRTPMVRQLRVTDSPFPVRDVEMDNHVDEAADDFISKFYSGLRKENELAFL